MRYVFVAEMTTLTILSVIVVGPFFIGLAAAGAQSFRNRGKK